MSVSRVDKNGDWTFGNGKANYATGSEEIAQNVVTRIQLFTNDWFLDVKEGIDWFVILSNKNNELTIRSEIERMTLETFGVMSITSIEFDTNQTSRKAEIILNYIDIYQEEIEVEANI